MVSLRRSQKGKGRWRIYLPSMLMVFAVISIVVVLDVGRGMGNLIKYTQQQQELKQRQIHQTSSSWRTEFQSECQGIIDRAGGRFTDRHWIYKEYLERKQIRKLNPPDTQDAFSAFQSMPQDRTMTNRPAYQYCRTVFIDLGTNRGDSIAYALDAALDVCTPLWIQANSESRNHLRFNTTFPHPHFDVDTFQIHSHGSRPIALLKRLQDEAVLIGIPFDEWCVYGMEGNPHFTEQLLKVENFVYAMKPRPLRHLHIHKEYVVADKDGPTELFVDNTSVTNHFWGSSLLGSMPDVRKTQRNNENQHVTANVTGIMLSTLIQKSLSPFDQNATLEEKRGGALLVKMDIEGAEYAVIKELARNGVICEYVRMGNNATLFVEFHERLMKNETEKELTLEGFREAQEQLKLCGVQFKGLPHTWTN